MNWCQDVCCVHLSETVVVLTNEQHIGAIGKVCHKIETILLVPTNMGATGKICHKIEAI